MRPRARQDIPGFGSSIRIVWRILRFSLPYWRGLSFTALSLIGTAAFMLATPELMAWAIDSAIGTDIVGDETFVDVSGTLVLVAALALVGAAVLRGLFQFLQSYLAEWVAQTVAYDMRNQIYERLQTLSFRYHDTAETGQIMVRATQDVEVVRMFLNLGGVRLLFTLIIMVAVLALMLVSSWKLALVVWPFLLLIAFRSAVISKTMRPIWMDVQEGQAQLGTVLQEALSGIRVVKAFGREEFEGRKFGGVAEWLKQRSYDANMVQAVNSPLMTALWMGSLIATVWVGGIEVANGNLSVGTLTAFLIYVQLLQMPVRSLGFMVMMVPRAASGGIRIFEILDQESDVQEQPGASVPANPRGELRFENVSFSYDEEAPVLRGIDFEAKPGELVALLGRTGSGKTTIVNLIPRFYDVSRGQILFDGQDVREWPMQALRDEVAIVQQDVFLFSATLRENIAYGRPDATMEEVVAAAKLARIHDFIENELPASYDTWVGERGANFSGGQKQRIAIARALLMDPKVLIFDDSTSSVDATTEYAIQQAMEALMLGRTTFVIAHRLRSVREADQIFVLDQGEIVQRGRHAELLAEGGIYREIYELELRDQESAYGAAGGGD